MVEDTLLRLSCKCDNIKVHTYVLFITKRLSHMELLLHYLRFLSRIVNRVAAAVATTRNFYGAQGREAGWYRDFVWLTRSNLLSRRDAFTNLATTIDNNSQRERPTYSQTYWTGYNECMLIMLGSMPNQQIPVPVRPSVPALLRPWLRNRNARGIIYARVRKEGKQSEYKGCCGLRTTKEEAS